jgi:disulfide bond formation protein DsbB
MDKLRLSEHLGHLVLAAGLMAAAAGCSSQQQPAAGGATTGGSAGQPTGAAAAATKPAGAGAAAVAAAGDAEEGKLTFAGTCTACHGPDAKGMPGLGKDLHSNAFVAEKTDTEMLAFLKVGRPATDPLNTTKVDMPPKGGNPALSEEDLLNIVAFLRTLK